MRKYLEIKNININQFKKQILIWGSKSERFAFLDSHHFSLNNKESRTYYNYNFLAGVNSINDFLINDKNGFDQLSEVYKYKDWAFGYLTYDLKNEIEELESKNIDILDFPNLHFFIPELVFTSIKDKLHIHYSEKHYSEKEILGIYNSINSIEIESYRIPDKKINIESRFTKEEYLETINKLKDHIQYGDIYEVNFCQEFFSKSEINPLHIYLQLKEVSPTPFSCFYKIEGKYILSASPERYLKKLGSKIISQPIKGTIRRGKTPDEDMKLKDQLLNDPKERAENVMIVDLVRNDLSRTAKKGTVKVEELHGIYTFNQVHHMISTVVSEIENNTNPIDVIKKSFPMGSMTGAPKIRAMQLIEQYERTKRGVYSGAVGYFTPGGDFDFNVVIRSILYNQLKKYISFIVGGAITSLSDPEKEYEECMVKAKAILEVLKS